MLARVMLVAIDLILSGERLSLETARDLVGVSHLASDVCICFANSSQSCVKWSS